ncbi:hypothetical protein [Corynebacterium callunae]|uniref:hypothetical protein n=1 Tax=Corynebacterium callunae TaxID=1721 RepID=UPI001FFEC9A7|nr:hypothetical protein [Corynebacterium callunae]MCK2199467.1 hypothetical protein [Corynebacterium callunae]
MDVSTRKKFLRDLQPRLYNERWTTRCRLSDDGFCDSPAHLNLSAELYMGLSSRSKTLSFRAVGELGLSIRQAWDVAADNLVALAQDGQGVRFDLRNASLSTDIDTYALEVKVPGSPITAWLAHPRTFSILHRHLESRLGKNLHYLASASATLIAIPAGAAEIPQLLSWAHSQSDVNAQQGLVDKLINYHLGFPAPYRPNIWARTA